MGTSSRRSETPSQGAPAGWARHLFRAGALTTLGVSLIVACSSGNNSNGSGSNSSSNATTGSTNSSSSRNGGSSNSQNTSSRGTSSGNGTSTSGSGQSGSGSGSSDAGPGRTTGDGSVTCTNSDPSELEINSTGWIDAACNSAGIQGPWYCYADTTSTSESTCVKGAPPYVAASSGMCLSGTIPASNSTTMTYPYVGLGLKLNQAAGDAGVAMPFNATAAGIIGFQITISGTTGAGQLQFNFGDATKAAATTAGAAQAGPQTASGPGTQTYNVLLSTAKEPTWATDSGPGTALDPTQLTSVEVEIPSTSTAITYNYCITSIKPIFAGSDAGTGSASCGKQACGQQQILSGVGNYSVQNNVFSSSSTGECVTANCSASADGFTANFTGTFGMGGTSSPSSYPSFIYGWNEGNSGTNWTTPNFSSPKLVSGLTTATSTFAYDMGGITTGDAAYDVWLSKTNTANRTSLRTTNDMELMIWYGQKGVVPATSKNSGYHTTLPFTVYTGTASGGGNSWQYVAYVANSPANSGNVTVDLKQIFSELASNNIGGFSSAWYLYSIQAGFEVYSATGTASVSSFSANVAP